MGLQQSNTQTPVYFKRALSLFLRTMTSLLSLFTVERPKDLNIEYHLPRRLRSIATTCKSILGSNITFKTNFDFTHTSFEVVQASITLQHYTLHFFCLYLPPPNRQNNPTDTMFTEQLPDLLDYITLHNIHYNVPGYACLVGDLKIHFDNPLQSLTKQTLTTLSLRSLVQVINKPTRKCSHIIDWFVVRPDDDIHGKSTVQTHINQTIIALNPTSTFQSISLLL